MTINGYARTSTVEQVAGLVDQIAKLKGAGCTYQSIYQEQISSVKIEDRVEFGKVLSMLKAGDVLRTPSTPQAPANPLIQKTHRRCCIEREGRDK